MKGRITDYCQNWKLMIASIDTPSRLLVTRQLWCARGQAALQVKGDRLEAGTGPQCGMLETNVKGQKTEDLTFVFFSVLPPVIRFLTGNLN